MWKRRPIPRRSPPATAIAAAPRATKRSLVSQGVFTCMSAMASTTASMWSPARPIGPMGCCFGPWPCPASPSGLRRGLPFWRDGLVLIAVRMGCRLRRLRGCGWHPGCLSWRIVLAPAGLRLVRGMSAPWCAAAASACPRARTGPGVGTCGPAAASVAAHQVIAALAGIRPGCPRWGRTDHWLGTGPLGGLQGRGASVGWLGQGPRGPLTCGRTTATVS